MFEYNYRQIYMLTAAYIYIQFIFSKMVITRDSHSAVWLDQSAVWSNTVSLWCCCLHLEQDTFA